ncbi:MAG TPA: hypothetical protein PKH33_12685 [bacterium]|nr:hypothetical protein [bacterium]
MNIEKMKNQLEKLNQDIESAGQAESEARMALDAAVDLLADGGSGDKVDAARRTHEKTCDRFSALTRKRDRLQAESDRLQAGMERQARADRLKEILGSYKTAWARKTAIVGALKFEGGNRDERLRAMQDESKALSGELQTTETEAEQLAVVLGDETVRATLNELKQHNSTESEIREALLDFGILDSWAARSIEHTLKHGAIPLRP